MLRIGKLLFILSFLLSATDTSAQSVATHVNQLFDELWSNPIAFDRHGKMKLLIDSIDHVPPADFLNIVNRIFEDRMITDESTSSQGTIGYFNRVSGRKRAKRFNRSLKNGFRNSIKYPTHKLVVADGDSWFQFPVFIKDIVDHLNKREDLAILSLAKGGDWLSSVIKENRYLKSYIQYRPDVMLISAGGNDMVKQRLTSIVDKPENISFSQTQMDQYRDYLITRLTDIVDSPICNDDCPIPDAIARELTVRRDSVTYDKELLKLLMHGRKFITDRFYVLLTLHKLQYYVFLENLKKADPDYFYNHLTIITQGYDYPIPRFNKGPRIKQGIVNSMTDHGEWLKLPLMAKGIVDEYDQRAVMASLIFSFNEMLIDVIMDPRFDHANIFLIDCRGAIESMTHMKRKYYWFDEMHPSSAIFGEISKAYLSCIDGEQQEKILRLDAKIKNAFK